MTIKKLQELGAIYFEKVQTGLKDYTDEVIEMTDKEAIKLFKELKSKHGDKNSYTDFYYFKLDDVSREMIDEELTDSDKEYLESIRPTDFVDEQIVFPLTDNLLRIVAKLNASEILFSTIYFLESEDAKRVTYWGNYNSEYICFKDK